MPQAVIYVVAALIGTGAAATIIGTVLYYAVVIAATRAYSNAQARKMQSRIDAMKGALDTSRTMMVRDPIVVRTDVYGQDKISGPMAYWETVGSGTSEYHHFIVIINAGIYREIQSIDHIWFGDEIVEIDGDGEAIGRYAGYLRFKKHLGAVDQVADADLVAASAGLWTSNHRLRGIPYLYVRMKWSPDIFPNGLLNIAAEIHGVKVYDPRTEETAWSDNAALCTADYMNKQVGIPYSEMNLAELISSANICDEPVPLA